MVQGMQRPRPSPSKLTGLLAVVVVACGPTGRAQPPGETTPATAAAAPTLTVDRERLPTQLDAILDTYGARWGPAFGYHGFVLVAQGDDVLYQRGMNQVDGSAGPVPDIDTTFRVGSVTKQFTATAILVLREQGKLDVTDTVRSHLPDFPAPAGDVTIHQLLTHTAGVWSYTSDPEMMATREQPRTVDQMLALFRDEPLDFEPGSKFHYSNSGYILLGAIVEAASGMSYGQFLQQALFDPAGMTRTSYGDQLGLDNRAEGYEVTPDEQLTKAHAIDMSVPYAAGGIRSTPRDLWSWHRALAGDAILSEDSKALLYTPEKSDYAYGWVVDAGDRRVVRHAGGIDGFATDYRRMPDEDIVVVAWSTAGLQAAAVGEAALRLAMGDEVPLPDEREVAPFDPTIGPRATGHYDLDEEGRTTLAAAGFDETLIDDLSHVELTADDRSLLYRAGSQPTGRMHPAADGSYFEKGEGAPTMKLDLPDGDGRVEGIWIRQGPFEAYYGRTEHAAEPDAR